MADITIVKGYTQSLVSSNTTRGYMVIKNFHQGYQDDGDCITVGVQTDTINELERFYKGKGCTVEIR